MKVLIANIFGCRTKRNLEMTSYLNNGHDVMNYFAKFEKFFPHRIIIPSFMTVGSQMPELDRGSQNTPYKLRLKAKDIHFLDVSEKERIFLVGAW